MGKLLFIPLMSVVVLFLHSYAGLQVGKRIVLLAGSGSSTYPTRSIFNKNSHTMDFNTIKLTLESGKTFTATLADNSSAQALKQLLLKGDLTIHMEDYGDMEKVGPLGTNLPRNDRPTTTGPGDLILYQGKYFVIYYGHNSWNFTTLGKIEDVSGPQLLSALGKGNVDVTLSLE